ncbi:hypothetical protein A4A49_00936 [Nicotiana attenuata]|uniref:Uncharacterized protein n=1 Tax=Nicotiana attenuata TaxID=49451 RepID=A0A314LAH5_NICAT|nr:hypothetical protein A4A49_00936 [Nicotiana attenuata]
MSMENENEKEKSSFRSITRHRRSSSVSCFFSSNYNSTSDHISHVSSSSSSTHEVPKLKKSPNQSWIRSKNHHEHFPDQIKGKCKNIMNRFGRHRRHSSADFSYDQLSYAKNFEDSNETSFDDTEDFPPRNFTARLPSSPPNYSKRKIPTNVTKHE